MKRASAAQIKACDISYSGIINAEKCIAYLRGIGVEVEDALADSWLDTQSAHRFLRRMKRAALRINRWTCQCGEMEGFALRGEKAPRRRKQSSRKPAKCESCGSGFRAMSTWYIVTRDGTEKDYRPAIERIVPFDWRELLEEHRNPPPEISQ